VCKAILEGEILELWRIAEVFANTDTLTAHGTWSTECQLSCAQERGVGGPAASLRDGWWVRRCTNDCDAKRGKSTSSGRARAAGVHKSMSTGNMANQQGLWTAVAVEKETGEACLAGVQRKEPWRVIWRTRDVTLCMAS
jgi:hypothetical protein